MPIFRPKERRPAAANNKQATCWGRGPLWGFAWLLWPTAIAVDVWVTPGGDWLRHNDKSIKWFTVGGGGDDVFGDCPLLSSQWCSLFAYFTVLQTAASITVSVAAALLLVAACRRRPHRWYFSSGIFFALYAILQGFAYGLVTTIARKLEDALVANVLSSETSDQVPLPSLSWSSSSSSTPTEITQGTTHTLGFWCGVLGLNAGLILFGLSRQETPEVDPLCGCFSREGRKGRICRTRAEPRTAASAGSHAQGRRGSRTGNNMTSPTHSATAIAVVGAAGSILRVPRQPLAAPTHPRPSGSASGSTVGVV
eukprot:g2411.t1